MGLLIIIAVTVAVILIWKVLSGKKREVRRASADRAIAEAKRVPVTGKCPCGMPRCRYKNKPHPPAVMDEAPLRNRKRFGG